MWWQKNHSYMQKLPSQSISLSCPDVFSKENLNMYPIEIQEWSRGLNWYFTKKRNARFHDTLPKNCGTSRQRRINDQSHVYHEKNRYEIKFYLLCLMPEYFHCAIGSKRTEECKKQQYILRCPPCRTLRLFFVMREQEEYQPVDNGVNYQKNDETGNPLSSLHISHCTTLCR